ncbi:hypothetical protein VNO80_06234 [Phaseolus coccineus]|uniref:Peroxisomal and mitochondrial division factor 2-like n=1 Tax=Phaseolus coccineus TaxID=3886 RepID=A0AAN9RHF2_PHACN
MWLLLQLQALSLQSEYCFGDPTAHNTTPHSGNQIPSTKLLRKLICILQLPTSWNSHSHNHSHSHSNFLENHEKAYHVIIKAETWALREKNLKSEPLVDDSDLSLAVFLCLFFSMRKESTMADDGVANGGVDEQYGEESTTKIAVLQRERDELLNENAARKEEIKELTAELDGLRKDHAVNNQKIEEMQREMVQSREGAKAAEVIAAGAANLEKDLARLQHDIISEMSAAEEARADAAELRKALGEKESRVESLERKIGVLETKEIEERNKRIRFEEEMRDKIDEKEKEIKAFKQKFEELEKIAGEKKSELEKFEELEKIAAQKNSELEESVKQKLKLEQLLVESEKKVTVLESSIVQLREEAKEAEKVILSLKEKAGKTIKNIDRGVNGIDGEGKVLKLQWPVVAAAGSTGAVVAAAAVFYVCYGRRR